MGKFRWQFPPVWTGSTLLIPRNYCVSALRARMPRPGNVAETDLLIR